MASLKQQALMATLGILGITLLFGGLLSLAVNIAFEQLEEQPDLVIPGPSNQNAPSAPL